MPEFKFFFLMMGFVIKLSINYLLAVMIKRKKIMKKSTFALILRSVPNPITILDTKTSQSPHSVNKLLSPINSVQNSTM